MKYCSNCGENISDDNKFCEKCGGKLARKTKVKFNYYQFMLSFPYLLLSLVLLLFVYVALKMLIEDINYQNVEIGVFLFEIVIIGGGLYFAWKSFPYKRIFKKR